MMSISSTDNGITWSDPREEFELPGEAYYANQVIQDKTGRIHCIFHIFSSGKIGYRGRQLDLWYTSMVPGSSWSKPRMIWEGYVGSIRGFIELRNGNLVIPMSESDTSRATKPKSGEKDFGLFQVISLNSVDHGNTWARSANNLKIPVDPDQVTRYGAVEPAAIELNDGRIWMLIRTNKGHLYESFSHDSGRTWEEAKQSSFISSDSPASFLRLANGEIILLLNSDQRYDDKKSYANGGREALQAAISKDDGRTWKGFREVLVSPATKPVLKGDRGTAYPSAIETNDGHVLFVSGQGEESAIVMFNKKWLEEKSQKDERKEGPVYWTMHGTTGGSGVWNFPMTKKGRLTIRIKPGLPP
ncbi:MAG TPA: sialidase family protein, partial [Chitinophagaceae bacterium]|nr:sialidase family protein [Chitinophagaceae bacterium]